MRADVSPALIALLNAAGGAVPLIKFDMFTITLAGGLGQLFYGAADFTVAAADASIWNPPAIGGGGMWFDGVNWTPGLMSNGDGAHGHWKVGLDSDRWDLVFTPRAVNEITGAEFPDKINGVPWLEAAQAGALDNADLVVSTAYYAAMPAAPLAPGGESPVGTITKFRGLVGPVDCTTTAAYIAATDYRYLFTQMMPRNLYQSGCRHRLFDARCTLSAAGFTATATAAAGSTRAQIVATGAVAAPAGSATYTLGLLSMTAGLNSGFSRVVTSWDGGATFQLLAPFPFDVAAGDTFSVQAGCDKRLATCQAFSNQVNFGGEPYIPVPEVAVG